MRLHRLTLTAFGPFAAREHVDFDALSRAGLFLLHGATGAGKTSVLDAVCYALFDGVPGARQSQGRTALRSSHAGPATPTEVSLDLTVGGRRLEVTRRPEHPRPKRRGSGYTTDKAQATLREYDAATRTWRALSRSQQEIGRELAGLIGMSREQFCQVVLLPQGDFARFLRADAEERGRLLGRLFDTSRFKAVEEHLAERRGEALRRLRAADESLLALAHRMHQVAQPLPVDAAFPDLTPGAPGLADTVLEWAAQARTVARERAASTALAVHAAEHAERAAQHALARQQELARLQHRHDDARRRATALAAEAEAQADVRERLERSRRAETVTSALVLHERAASEHQRAAQTERRARAQLPGHLAQAPAQQLTAAERETRRALGSLDAARRAEERVSALTAELAALDRQTGADEEELRDAEEWLEHWPAQRAALQRRVDRAQAAATRAEHVGARLEAAERRLNAARERDRLDAEHSHAREHLHTARESATSAQATWLELKERRLAGIAAELAAGLTPGRPCAVCGSTDHPARAEPATGHVDATEEDAALAAYQDAETAREQAEQSWRRLRDARTVAAEAAGDAATGECATTVAELRQAAAEARHTAATAHAAQEALAQAEREHSRRLAARDDAGRRAAARTSHREALRQELTGRQQEVAGARGEAAGVAERTAHLSGLATALAAAAEAALGAESAARHLKQADADLADASWRAGFPRPEAAADALLADADARALRARLDAWQTEEAAVAAELVDPAVQDAAAQAPADVAAARRRAETSAAQRRAADTAATATRQYAADLDALGAQAADAVRRLAPRRAEHEGISRLAGLTAGTSADNERKMRLETYVLAARLEQVAAAAGHRLHRMSGGRYALVHSDSRASRGARSGLGLHVVDAWTGQERDTATLSGGETFFASLALALGLADVVGDEAGGTRLDTLFIDEGFGSLDEQTLDEVLDVLDGLRERDRCVGIVSHVPDLRLRIPTQLEVRRSRTGSTLRHHTDTVRADGP
ncbi:SMC family ATPase [Streptomyces sp. JJ66]|uniref:AAA family ATPase n=1 Tax=Streptomyces sp. JJ66 TaxID=2803843 RepID=UPI001C58D840|nr:SMC family ATPase [Streptomyces sp. JJ66]MBW1603304.1 SMC family ATPase [Streptomyces sp. JJ66]